MQFRKSTLDNGLEIVAECNPEAYSAALGFFVKTGARDEADEIAGVSHFLEHMAFKGSATRTADDVNRDFDEIGAQYNAYTGEEQTVYYAAVLPEYQDRALELLADILRPALRENDFTTEKKVIIEEIRMYDDQPPFGADEKCRALYFGAHPLGRSVLGTEATIGALAPDAMRGYFLRRYSPANIVLAGAGRIDFDALMRGAQQHCGAWEPRPSDRRIEPAMPCYTFRTLCKPNATQQYAVMMAAGPAATDADRYPAKLLAMILGDETGSRLYWELIDPGLAEHVSLNHYEYEGAGLMVTFVSCDPALATQNLQRIVDVYRAAEAHGVSKEELDQAKSKVSSRIVLSGERARARLFTVGTDWIQRRQYRSVRDDLEAVAAISVEEVRRVLEKYPLSRVATVTIGPLASVRPPE